MNGDHTIYARYGTRTTAQEADKDVSIDGLAETMRTVLKIHEDQSKYAKWIKGKQSKPTETKVPEDYPSLKKFNPVLDYSGEVSKSCIHCHQVRDAQRETFRSQGKPLPVKLMFPYPIPQSIGIVMDPKTKSSIAEVASDSFADKAGLKEGDSIEAADGQIIASPADLQWVLHHLEDSQLNLIIRRDNSTKETTVELPDGWKNEMDISWRVTSWEFRRRALGGMKLEPLEDSQRAKLDIPDDEMALHVQHVGKYGDHAVAHRAGVKPGDILIEFDGRRDLLTESKIMEYGMNQRKPNDKVKLVLMRDGKQLTPVIKLQ